MTKTKYDKYGQIRRTYKVKCPKCGKGVIVTEDDYICEYCETRICPRCLTVLVTQFSSIGLDGGWEIYCVRCGYEIAGA